MMRRREEGKREGGSGEREEGEREGKSGGRQTPRPAIKLWRRRRWLESPQVTACEVRSWEPT